MGDYLETGVYCYVSTPNSCASAVIVLTCMHAYGYCLCIGVVFLPLCQYLCHHSIYYSICCHACNWFHVLLQLRSQCHALNMGNHLRLTFIDRALP